MRNTIYMKKIYIAGKIGFLPEQVYKTNFETGKREAADLGFVPVSPVDLPHDHERTWKAYMREDLKALLECDAIYMLHNWSDSRGSKIEHWFAKRYGKEVFYQPEPLEVGSDFSGVGAFNQALMRLGIPYKEVFACDMDRFARKTFIHNYGEPGYYPENVYDREIPKKSLGIYMTSPPCQGFSLAGKREGSILFFNSLEFIRENNPRFFIFENVKGLLSHDKPKDSVSEFGRTFQEWINYLGGKSVNGNHTFFPYEDSVPYHIYFKVLNAKNFNIPQNRERVFIVGIRDDDDNFFQWPKDMHLNKRLKDILESGVDEKYFLSEKHMEKILSAIPEPITGTLISDRGVSSEYIQNDVSVPALSARTGASHAPAICIVGNVNPSGNGMNGNVFDSNGISPTLNTNKGEGIKVKINLNTSRTRVFNELLQFTCAICDTKHIRPIFMVCPKCKRVTGGVSNTLILPIKTKYKPDVIVGTLRTHKDGEGFREISDGNCPTIPARAREDGSGQPVIKVVCFGRSETEKKRRRETFRTTGKDSGTFKDKKLILKDQDYVDTILANPNPQKEGLINVNYSIRRLTPRECFRCMDFPDSFSWPVSDAQAYKQAGNSICVGVLAAIISKLPLIK